METVKSNQELKKDVRDKYASIAVSSEKNSCCGGNSCSPDYSFVGDGYGGQDGYVEEADLNLGCGLPVEFARIRKGDTVVDLGSGAGNDVFIARAETGEEGKVVGLDFTQEMLDLAEKNASKLGYSNVEFVKGDIEAMPLDDEMGDVVVSNCVLNLVPDKAKAYGEIYRILRPGGHFSISDIVVEGDIPEDLKYAAEMYAGCICGSIPLEDYVQIVEDAGFEQTEIQKKRKIDVPNAIVEEHLNEHQIELYRNADFGIYSVTVFAKRPES